MLEWYRANETYEAVITDSIVVVAHAAQATGIGAVFISRQDCDPFAEPELLNGGAAFERFMAASTCWPALPTGNPTDALAVAAKQKCGSATNDTWSDIFSKVLVEHVEPNLGQGRLTVLFEYPAPEARWRETKPGDPRVAERFEVYACGVELANGFGELTDAGRARAAVYLRRNGRKGATLR